MARSERGRVQEMARLRAQRRTRPARVEPPGPGQESVWEYPRPPRVEAGRGPVRVEFAGSVIAASDRPLRVIETSGAPVYFLPRADVRSEWLAPSARTSLCEWKGVAHYWSVRVGERVAADAVFAYPDPERGYEPLLDHFAFYPGKMDACLVAGERVVPQPGDFYAGWITRDVVGPFKGEPGTEFW